ncbi:BRCA1-associated protein [Arachis hypogaea]|nr:BRCA1-associated protein [Arachis hypogaea]
MRIVRMGGTEDQYSILICFNDQGSTDSLFKHYNGRRFSSMEVEVCCVLFTLDVQYTGSVEHAQPSNATSTEQPTCPVCLESLDQDTPVEFSLLYVIIPFIVRAYQNRLILLVLCAAIANNKLKNPYVLFVGTLRTFGYVLYAGLLAVEGHAIMHSKETQHCYALDMETKHVWDFVGDNYVHRLIQSKTDRKLVELNTHCVHAENGCGSCSCEDNSMSEALLNSKVEVIINEYNELLATQLENQKSYFESLLQEVKEETERKISKAVQKAVSLKQQKIQAKIDRCNKEKKFLEELRYLMTCLDDAKPEQQQLPEHNEIKDGLLSASSKESSSTTNSQLGKNP